jgi:hypothetical protein
MDSINGVSLEKYAELCALMANTGGDEAKEFAIATEHGISNDDWKAAKAGWTAKFSDPADMGKTAMAFMPLFQAAQTKLRGGGEPCSLELFAKVHAEMSFTRDPNNPEEKIDYHIILQRNNLTEAQWNEYNTYWTFKVIKGYEGNPEFKPELSQKYLTLHDEEAKKIVEKRTS